MARPQPRPNTMIVRVPFRGARSATDESRFGPLVVSVAISARCPRCGRPRGKPEPFRFIDYLSQVVVKCQRWENTCGHVDLYADVIAEGHQVTQEGG